MIIKTLTLGPLQTNCYIVYDEVTKEAAVFDPAASFGIIQSEIDNEGLNIKYIIITHAHYDHIAALDELKLYTNAKICIGAGDASALSNGQYNLCHHFGGISPVSPVDIKLNDGDTISISNCEMVIISTPGHTAGGICIKINDSLISGDTLFFESIGRTDFPTGSTIQLLNSIKNKLFVLNQNTIVYPGHGPSTTISHEISHNPYIR